MPKITDECPTCGYDFCICETTEQQPLNIVITEAGSDNLLFRALLRKSISILICGSQTQRQELANAISVLLDEATPEDPETALCIGCGGYLEACYCGVYPDNWDGSAESLPTVASPEIDAYPTFSERLAESAKDDRADW